MHALNSFEHVFWRVLNQMSCSTVFSAMFENEMEESLSGTIKTVDVSYGTLRAFVNYLYTAEVVCLDQQLACDLLVMADKYQAQHLKDLCQKFLVSNLNWDNSLSTCTFVHQHNAKQIINLALTLITDNMDKLTTGEEYAELKEKDPRLIFETYEACKTICFLRCGIICFQTSNNISFLPYKLPTKASSQIKGNIVPIYFYTNDIGASKELKHRRRKEKKSGGLLPDEGNYVP
ncbi:unnamed protein product [Prunus armeniaca]|uniref:BTB domain-containing protein n=1 Tax=Prunus armeniaca TaxID=36596 RepID=A0A6J5TT10_PRUAR|nr:unnamed protein product [Prunus armeniaca]